MARIEFTETTKRIAACRSGYRCSYPACNRLTVGPGRTPDETVLTGQAAHIFSAAPNGPRGRGTLTENQLRSVSNCMWLCDSHAREIDLKRGKDYPAALLLAYKDVHEARIAREQRGEDTPLGWIHELVIRDSVVFRPGSVLRFGKVTLVQGANSSGKTAICQFLSGISQPTDLLRWSWAQEETDVPTLILDLRCYSPIETKVRIEVRTRGRIQYSIDGTPAPFQPYPFRFIYLPHYNLDSTDPEEDEINIISSILRVDPVTTVSLLSHVPVLHGHVLKLDVRESRGRRTLYSELMYEKLDLPFLGRSHSQQASILIELAAVMACHSSRYVPTFLLIDGGVATLDGANLTRCASIFSSSDNAFQTLMVLPYPRIGFSDLDWAGWQIARLSGQRREVEIIQDW